MKKLFTFLLLLLLPAFFVLRAEEEIQVEENSIAFEVASSYLRECSKKAKKFPYRLEKNGTCGFVSLGNVHMEAEVENGFIVIKSTVYGDKKEFDDYTVFKSKNDSLLLKYKLLKAHQNAKKDIAEGVTIIDNFTKGERRVIYSGNRGWTGYRTVLTRSQLAKIRKKVLEESALDMRIEQIELETVLTKESKQPLQKKYEDAIQHCLDQIEYLKKNKDKYEDGVADAAIENCLKQAEELSAKISREA